MSDKNNRTLVQIDDDVVEIVKGKNGFTAKRLNDDEVATITLLDKGVAAYIDNDINKITNEAYEELKKDFKNNIKNNALKVIGFENRWNGNWEVDHCNGRQSLLTQLIADKVQTLIKQEFANLLPTDIKQLSTKVKKEVTKEYEDSFLRTARRVASQQAEEEAKAFVKKTYARQFVKLQKQALERTEIAFLGREIDDDDDLVEDEDDDS